MTDSGTKCARVTHESKAVQMHVHTYVTIAAASMCNGCLVALTIHTTTNHEMGVIPSLHFALVAFITIQLFFFED